MSADRPSGRYSAVRISDSCVDAFGYVVHSGLSLEQLDALARTLHSFGGAERTVGTSLQTRLRTFLRLAARGSTGLPTGPEALEIAR